MQQSSAMGAKEWGTLIVLSVIWGSSFVLLKVLIETIPPLTIVFGRLAISALAMNLVTRGGAFRPEILARWPEFVFYGLVSAALPFSLITLAETEIDSGLASILNATTPIFAVVIAHFSFADERLSWNKGVGALAGFLGVVVLIGPSALAIGRDGLAGQMASLVAALSYGCASVFARRFRGLAPLNVVAAQMTIAALLVAPASLIVDRPFDLTPPPPVAWASLAALALICTAFSYWLYFRLVAKVSGTVLSVATVLSPVSAVALGVMFLGERLEFRALGGLLLIALGLAAMDGRPLARLRRSRA